MKPWSKLNKTIHRNIRYFSRLFLRNTKGHHWKLLFSGFRFHIGGSSPWPLESSSIPRVKVKNHLCGTEILKIIISNDAPWYFLKRDGKSIGYSGGWFYSIWIRVSSEFTWSPSFTWMVLTTPSIGAVTWFSIFMAMKMENQVTAPIDGVVKTIHVKEGDQVNSDETLIQIE